MIGEYMRLSVGMLLIVDKAFTVKVRQHSSSFMRIRRLKKGQIIELRYQSDWHFRTECDTYAESNAEILSKNCSFFGAVHEVVRFSNEAKLSDILKGELYHKPCEYQLNRKVVK